MITTNDLIYAKKLKNFRINSKLKQLAVYELIGFNSQQEYSKPENGKLHFTDEHINRICEIFNLNVSEFRESGGTFISGVEDARLSDKNIFSLILKAKEETIDTLKKLNSVLETQIRNYEATVKNGVFTAK